MKPNVRKLFRIFYRIFFGIISLCTTAILIITPADAIQQALRNRQPYNVFVIAGAYFVTFIFAALIWLTRWWSNKQALKAIPKSYIPVEKGDVNKKVRRMIVASLSRSATIAWNARPRSENETAAIVSAPDNRDSFVRTTAAESTQDTLTEKDKKKRKKKDAKSEKNNHIITIPPPKPVWGDISHNGWSSPTTVDLPNVQYITVVKELPHLIEARAVSLAPPAPNMLPDQPSLDVRAASLLQRPAAMGLRDYVGHLTSIGVFEKPESAMNFLSMYEYARFSGAALSEAQFRELMKLFADVLKSMQPIPQSVIAELDAEIDNRTDAASISTTGIQRSVSNASLRSSRSGNTEGTIHIAPLRTPRRITTPMRNQMSRSVSDSPNAPQDEQLTRTQSRNSSIFAQSRRVYTGSTGSSASSLRSTSQGSVIRLSRRDEASHLPCTLTLPDGR